jgi:serpin B
MRAQGPGNVVLSPDSVAAALAMTGTGGVGRTAGEIARTLHLKGPTALAAVGDLQRAIAARQAAAAVGDPEPLTLEIANGLFLQQGLPFEPAFLSGAQERFGAAPLTVDFAGDPTGALDAINRWVRERTKGLVPRILDSLPEEMALALANAVYLDADWKYPFKQRDTRPGVFHKAAGKTTVDFMHQTAGLRYGAGPGYRAVALPYRSSTLSLLVVLPVRQRLGSLQHRLDGRALVRIARGLSARSVILSLPRFHLNTEAELTGTLKRLGIRTAFSEAADFSRMTTAVPLKVASSSTPPISRSMRRGQSPLRQRWWELSLPRVRAAQWTPSNSMPTARFCFSCATTGPAQSSSRAGSPTPPPPAYRDCACHVCRRGSASEHWGKEGTRNKAGVSYWLAVQPVRTASPKGDSQNSRNPDGKYRSQINRAWAAGL